MLVFAAAALLIPTVFFAFRVTSVLPRSVKLFGFAQPLANTVLPKVIHTYVYLYRSQAKSAKLCAEFPKWELFLDSGIPPCTSGPSVVSL